MKTQTPFVLALCVTLAGCGGTSQAEADPAAGDRPNPSEATPETRPDPPPAAEVSPPRVSTVPGGTTLEVELDEPLGPGESRVGDVFNAHVDDPVLARDGTVGLPEDAAVTGEVTALYGGDAERPAAMRVEVRTVAVAGEVYDLNVELLDTEVGLGDRLGQIDQAGEEAGVGAIAGAAVGQVLGGDAEATVLGGALGAGAGAAIALGSGEGAELPEGADLVVRLEEDLHIRR